MERRAVFIRHAFLPLVGCTIENYNEKHDVSAGRSAGRGADLTERPYPGGSVTTREGHFHTEGLRNDHIVATTMYVVEAKNITQARVVPARG
jgi:hypothetical protein